MLEKIKTNTSTRPPKILIYSDAGIGKTTFAAQSPNPIFLRTEDGLAGLPVKTTDVIKTFADFKLYLNALLNEKHDYKTIVVDSLDHLEPLINTHVCHNFKVRSIEDLGYGRGYVEALAYWQYVFDMLDSICTQRNCIIILICHAEIKMFNDPNCDSYDRHQLKLHRRAAALAIEIADCVCFASCRTAVHRAKSGEKGRGISTGERVMYTDARPGYLAKNRYNLQFEMPLDIKKLLSDIKSSVNNGDQNA